MFKFYDLFKYSSGPLWPASLIKRSDLFSLSYITWLIIDSIFILSDLDFLTYMISGKKAKISVFTHLLTSTSVSSLSLSILKTTHHISLSDQQYYVIVIIMVMKNSQHVIIIAKKQTGILCYEDPSWEAFPVIIPILVRSKYSRQTDKQTNKTIQL